MSDAKFCGKSAKKHQAYSFQEPFPMLSFGCCEWREIGDFFDGVEIAIERLKDKWLKNGPFGRRFLVPPRLVLLTVWIAYSCAGISYCRMLFQHSFLSVSLTNMNTLPFPYLFQNSPMLIANIL